MALVCGLIVALYLNELWLAPFGVRTTLDALRALTILAIPVAAAAGLAVHGSRARSLGLLAASAALAIATTFTVVPVACVSKPIDVAEIERFDVDRCMFRWRYRRASGAGAQRLQVRPDALVDRTAPLEGAPQ